LGARGRPKEYTEERPVMAVRLPKPLYKKVHHEAIDRETTVTKIVEAALHEYLQQSQGAAS
jgi:hypothetical protein